LRLLLINQNDLHEIISIDEELVTNWHRVKVQEYPVCCFVKRNLQELSNS
jgi:hypothetical protein